MLAPETRALLTDALRPPDGFRVDTAVATTYSLDLTALLLAPLSFALHDYDTQEVERVDPIRLLEAVRRHADHTTVFCQAGSIHVPASYRSILAFAEESVCQVMPPATDRVFHPKIWVIRFTDTAGRTLHRFLCLSRNLTFDRSWDTLLRLDELDAATDSDLAADPHPLADFIEGLPDLCVPPFSDERRTQVAGLAASVRACRFRLPEGFDSITFLPLGLATGPTWPFPASAEKVLAISAFLDVATLRRLTSLAPEAIVVSRPESFDRVGSAALARSAQGYTLQRSAEVEVGDQVSEPVRALNESDSVPEGLHAKTFIVETGDRALVVTGSANATQAGFGGNVEFDVVLEGPRSLCGVAAVWDGSKESPGLSRLAEPYEIPTAAGVTEAAAETEWLIDRFHTRLASGNTQLHLQPAEEHRFFLTLAPVGEPSPGETRFWPVSLPRDVYALRLLKHEVLMWGPIGLRNVTPFLAVETTAGEGAARCTRTAVIKAELIGDLPERRQDALRDILRNKLDVLRYLVFLLGDPAYEEWLGLGTPGEGDGWRRDPALGATTELALFEPLVRAVARNDDSLERVASLIADLQVMEDEGALMPDGFDEIWQAVWEVYREART